MNAKRSPELANYFEGFEQGNEEEELMADEEGEKLYSEHLAFDEMVLGVKQGRFFQGRMNVSRLSLNEASVKVEGLSQEILLTDLQAQNRALNGDIVCLEIKPETQWIKDFKTAEPVNALLEDDQDHEKAVHSDEEDSEDGDNVQAKRNQIEWVNSETRRKVTGQVRGILKKMNKTYGGSILSGKAMAEETKAKLARFFEAFGVSPQDKPFYRVFVAYN